jgi:hypothetical protein
MPGVAAADYIGARIEDLLALLPAVEWMVDMQTLFHLAEFGCLLGEKLRERGVALAAWTIKDHGPGPTRALAERLFALGAETLITDAPLALARYLAG